MKICLIRLDKIGDLVSTLPVDQIPELVGHEVRWVISQGLGFLAARAEPARNFIELPIQDPKSAKRVLRDFLDNYQPDLAIFFYGPWWVSKVLWQARVPRRFGRRSQWHSYLFLNAGLRQSRSRGEKHESEYNLDLLEAALQKFTVPIHESPKISTVAVESPRQSSVGLAVDSRAPKLKLNAPSLRHLFEKFDLRSDQYFVVHAGMAGSALNWPIRHYISLIEKLKKEKEVVLTGTAADERWLAPLKEKFSADPRVQILQGQLSMHELLFVLKNSAGVTAPSTGVLHLAASVGAKTVGLYSPIASQHPKRWGPRGPFCRFLLAELPPENERAGKPLTLESITPEQVIECLKSI